MAHCFYRGLLLFNHSPMPFLTDMIAPLLCIAAVALVVRWMLYYVDGENEE